MIYNIKFYHYLCRNIKKEMIQIKTSVIDDTKFFIYEGLEYSKGLFKITYSDIEQTNSGVDYNKVKVGIKYKEDNSVLMGQTLIKNIEIDEVQNLDLNSFIASLSDLINFDEAGGSSPTSVNLQQVTNNGNVTTNAIETPEIADRSDAEKLMIINKDQLIIGNVGNDYGGESTKYVSFFDPEVGKDDEVSIVTTDINDNSTDLRLAPTDLTLTSLYFSLGELGTVRTSNQIFLRQDNIILESREVGGVETKLTKVFITPDEMRIQGSASIIGKNGLDGDPTAPASPLTVVGGNGSNSVLTTGVVVAGAAAEIKIEGGNGGNATSSTDFNIAGKGGDVYFVAGDGGIASGATTNLDGSAGNASLQGGETRNGVAGFAALKAGNASGLGVQGGNVYIVGGFGNGLDDSDESLYNGTVFINLSPNLTSVRGNTVIGNTTDDRQNRLQVTGKIKTSSSIQIGDNTDLPFVDNVGAIRYREDGSGSYCEMCMKTDTSSYSWVTIQQNTF